DDVGTMRLEREELRRNSLLLEHLFQVLRSRLLASRRIGGVHAHERLEVTKRLFLDARPVRLSGRLCRNGDRRDYRGRARDDVRKNESRHGAHGNTAQKAAKTA